MSSTTENKVALLCWIETIYCGIVDKFFYIQYHKVSTLSERVPTLKKGGNSMALRPGKDAPSGGVYQIVGPRGGKQHGTVQIPSKGTTMPPTPLPNSTFTKK